MKKNTLFSLLLVGISSLAIAQRGSIKGQILDAASKEAEVTVYPN